MKTGTSITHKNTGTDSVRVSLGGKETDVAIVYSLRRLSVEISVRPDGRVGMRAPVGTSAARLRELLAKRERWILKKQQQFRLLPIAMPPRAYAEGETHLYLGRQYRLRTEVAADYGVELRHDWLFLRGPDMSPAGMRIVLKAWYLAQAWEVFGKLYDGVWPRFVGLGYERPVMRVKDMTSRWGSLSVKGNMSLNMQLIKGPVSCIEYVLVHELCHLRHRNHGREFYRMLAGHLPDWRAREQRIRELALTCRGD